MCVDVSNDDNVHEDSEDNEGQFFRTRNFVMEECAVPVGRRRKVHQYEPRRISHMN